MTTEPQVTTAVGIGDRLANGATVLQKAPSAAHAGGVRFLALSRGEFATWVGAADGTATCWGHYFRTDLEAALIDFRSR